MRTKTNLKLLAMLIILSITFISSAADKKIIMSYWSDWNIYSADPATRAIPEPAYGVPGSYDSNDQSVTNADFTEKLDYINILAYDFLEVQETGAIYFNDPNSDLRLPDTFCEPGEAGDTENICSHAQMPEKWGRGNFEAFANIENKNLSKVISIGGYGHDDSFANAMKDTKTIKKFVQTVGDVITHYHLQGVDLDYEKTISGGFSAEDAKQYVALIETLRSNLPVDTLITVTIPADPAWSKMINEAHSNNWATIAKDTDYINLMTYDFHGAFDNPQNTGFLTNLYPAKSGQKFSINESVQDLINYGVPAGQIVIGVPAYGRAIEGVEQEGDAYGLNQSFSERSVPRGDLDASNCNTLVTAPACSGTFQYKYIIGHMLGQGFTDYSEMNSSKPETNGVWAYAPDNWEVQYPIAVKSPVNLSKTFISYANTALVTSMAKYVKDNKLGGMMMWELRGDISVKDEASLLKTMKNELWDKS